MEERPYTPPPSSPVNGAATDTPQSCCSFEDEIAGAWSAIEEHEAVREFQEIVNSYYECFRLHKYTATAVELLREENRQLVAENLSLKFMTEKTEREEEESERAAAAAAIGISSAGRSLRALEERGEKTKIKGSDLNSPGGSGSASGSASVVESGSGSGSGSDGARSGGGVPKSISIRSPGYLALNQSPVGGTHRLRLPASPVLHAGDNEPSEVELEVYSQGTA